MNGKFVLALVALVCVGQVYSASIPTPTQPSFAVTKSAVDEIIHQLNILIDRIGQGISELSALIADLEERMAAVISDADLPAIFQDLVDQVESIVQEAGISIEAAAGCINQARKAGEDMLKNATNGVGQCVDLVDPVRKQIVQQVADISSDGGAIIASISKGIGRCYRDHPLNPSKLLACLNGLVDPAAEQTNELAARIGQALTEDRVLITQVIEQLTPCVQSVADGAVQREQVILQDFRQCLSEISKRHYNRKLLLF